MFRIWRSMSSIIRSSPLHRDDTPPRRGPQDESTEKMAYRRCSFGEAGLQRNPALRLRREGVIHDPSALPQQGGVGDHGGVVAGVDEGNQPEIDLAPGGPGGETAAEEAVG